MKKANVNNKAIRIWQEMNRNTTIKVKTPVGITDGIFVGNCVAQGTISAALVSATNLDKGMCEVFDEVEDVVKYGNIRLQPLTYQDDIGDICSDSNMLRSHAKFIEKVLDEKKLDAHDDKTGITILGSSKYRQEILRDIEKNPIFLRKFKIKLKQKVKYLGQILCDNLSESALATVIDRQARIKGACIEFKTILEDYSMQRFAGLEAAVILWEKALIPSLLNGAGTWIGDIKNTVKLCNNIQDFYWRIILEVPASCPKVALQSETGMMDMSLRIEKMKCLLLLKIKNMEGNALAKQILMRAEKNGENGLNSEVRDICRRLCIGDLNEVDICKNDLNFIFKKEQISIIKKKVEDSSKLSHLKWENFHECAPYFKDKNISNARMKFRFRTKMTKNIPGNFKNNFKYNQADMLCSFCPVNLTQEHLLICPKRSKFREDLDMNNLDDIIIYIRRTLEGDHIDGRK